MTSANVWSHLEALLHAGDTTALALAVDDLDEGARKACRQPLRAFLREQDPWSRERVRASVVAAGVLPDAKSVAAVLNRGVESAPHIAFVLTRRGVDWLPQLVELLAAKLSRDHLRYSSEGDHAFDLVQKLRAATGTPAPTTDGFVVGLVGNTRDPDEVQAAFAADPSLAAVMPRLFEIDHVGLAFSHDDRWTTALVAMASDGRLDRPTLIDACFARLARAGKPGASTAYLHVAQALDLTAEELGQRVTALVAMIAGPTLSTVASFAQAALMELPARLAAVAGDEAVAFTGAALRRNEKKVVRAQLSWVAGLDAGGREPHLAVVAAALPALPADLARAAAKILPATDVPTTAVTTEAPRLQPFVVGTVEPLQTLREVVDELGALSRWTPQQAARQASQLERVVDALIRWRATDRDALRAAVSPFVEESAHLREYHEYSCNRTLPHALMAVVCAAAGLEPMPEHPVEEWLRRVPRCEIHPPPARHAAELVLERLFALARNLDAGVGVAVALPTHTDGTIAAAVLTDRLVRAAAAGVEPAATELDQALLRMTEPEDREAMVAQLRGLGTTSARYAADHVAGATAVAVPAFSFVARARDDAGWESPATRRWTDLLVQVRPGNDGDAGSDWWQELCRFDPMHQRPAVHETFALVPAIWVAPRHREVITAQLLPAFAGEGDSELLPVLATIDGDYGDAMALAVVYGLTASRANVRDDAVDATIILCRRGLFEGRRTGKLLGDLVSRGALVTQRLVEPLRRTADAGAHHQVWEVLEEALPALITDEPRGLADLLALGVELAGRCDVHITIGGLADFAARKGSSRQLVEARLLRDALARTGVTSG